MTKNHLIPTLIALIAGIAGLLIVLYAWHLPPFRPAHPQTENAYIRGQLTSISPQLSGYVATVEVQDFQAVREGQVIARIDDRQYRQKLAQAQAALQGAQAALEIQRQSVHSARASLQSAEAALRSAEAARDTAKSNWDRAQALQSRGVTAQSSADQSELALRQAEAAVTQAESAIAVARENVAGAEVGLASKRAGIASARAEVELARIDLDNTVIRAPADGRLGQVGVRVGQYVTAGTVLVSHVGPEVWVIANFKETELHGMRLGDRASFTVDAMRHRAFTGRIEAFSPATASEFSLLSSSNATGNFTKVAQRLPVRIAIDPGQEMAEYLEPGLSVVVTVDEGSGQRDRSASLAPLVMGHEG
ncbi:biotin/lipoyl-binding protein [Paracoccus kondratievae]|uniref:Hemolysin secretion protein D n=1 Tax=Paracoccus kondratievae TaxID=135740 RepID=A0AAD3P2U0_9RHOB|nr:MULTISPECIES: HlyD family secretion protein [Paracoccus]QFQ87852.1 biotin/lipoyl-binding protein [Paracoccus kondratievae]GLK66324.1 hemolysin secretion protein D [Paracoccus kondratievae]SMG32834.1 Multidrug resistance efflux pump [Paracoccus sp. J56]